MTWSLDGISARSADCTTMWTNSSSTANPVASAGQTGKNVPRLVLFLVANVVLGSDILSE